MKQYKSLKDIQADLSTGLMTLTELVSMYLNNIETNNTKLNALIEVYGEEAIERAHHIQSKYNKQFHLPLYINDMTNVIFYGPSGSGKYAQMLKSIQHLSQSKLKYEKRLNVTFNKDIYLFKIRKGSLRKEI